MWTLVRSLLNTTRCFVSVGTWSGMTALALAFWALGDSGDSNGTSMMLLLGILFLLLVAGILLLGHGIIDLVRDLRKSIHERTDFHQDTRTR